MYNSNNDNNKNNQYQNFPGRKFFSTFELTVFENKRTSFIKKAVRHTSTLIHCKARQVLHDLFNTN